MMEVTPYCRSNLASAGNLFEASLSRRSLTDIAAKNATTTRLENFFNLVTPRGDPSAETMLHCMPCADDKTSSP